jgi:hypothetical protein
LWHGQFGSRFAVWAPFGSNPAKAAWFKVEPADAGFSVFFPATPTMETKEEHNAVSRVWVARAGNILCLITVTNYNGRIDAERELDLDMKNFLKAIEGSTATAQQKLSFRDAPDGPLPALHFDFTSPGWIGQSLVVVSGDRSYMSAALGSAGYDPKAWRAASPSRSRRSPAIGRLREAFRDHVFSWRMTPAFAGAGLFRKPVPTPHQVRGRLFRDHALGIVRYCRPKNFAAGHRRSSLFG